VPHLKQATAGHGDSSIMKRTQNDSMRKDESSISRAVPEGAYFGIN
jgi:hypothetical protein